MKKLTKKITFMSLSLLLPLSAQAECSLSNKGATPLIGFKAFKTAAKVGVPGTFSKVTWQGSEKAKTLQDLLKGQKFEIDTSSVKTKNPARDQKIFKFFFSELAGSSSISGTITKVSSKDVSVEISLNGKKKLVPLNYSFKDSKFHAIGHIDLLDFAAEGPLASINKACYALHEGKTWSHVELEVNHSLPGCKP